MQFLLLLFLLLILTLLGCCEKRGPSTGSYHADNVRLARENRELRDALDLISTTMKKAERNENKEKVKTGEVGR